MKKWENPELKNLSVLNTETELVEGMPCPDCGGEWVWEAADLKESSNAGNKPGNGCGGHHNHKPGCGHCNCKPGCTHS